MDEGDHASRQVTIDDDGSDDGGGSADSGGHDHHCGYIAMKGRSSSSRAIISSSGSVK